MYFLYHNFHYDISKINRMLLLIVNNNNKIISLHYTIKIKQIYIINKMNVYNVIYFYANMYNIVHFFYKFIVHFFYKFM